MSLEVKQSSSLSFTHIYMTSSAAFSLLMADVKWKHLHCESQNPCIFQCSCERLSALPVPSLQQPRNLTSFREPVTLFLLWPLSKCGTSTCRGSLLNHRLAAKSPTCNCFIFMEDFSWATSSWATSSWALQHPLVPGKEAFRKRSHLNTSFQLPHSSRTAGFC